MSIEGTRNKLLVLSQTHYGRSHDLSPRQPMPCVEAHLEVKRNRNVLPDSGVSQTDAIEGAREHPLNEWRPRQREDREGKKGELIRAGQMPNYLSMWRICPFISRDCLVKSLKPALIFHHGTHLVLLTLQVGHRKTRACRIVKLPTVRR